MATDLAPARKDGNHGDRAYRINDRHRASGLPYNVCPERNVMYE